MLAARRAAADVLSDGDDDDLVTGATDTTDVDCMEGILVEIL